MRELTASAGERGRRGAVGSWGGRVRRGCTTRTLAQLLTLHTGAHAYTVHVHQNGKQVIFKKQQNGKQVIFSGGLLPSAQLEIPSSDLPAAREGGKQLVGKGRKTSARGTKSGFAQKSKRRTEWDLNPAKWHPLDSTSWGSGQSYDEDEEVLAVVKTTMLQIPDKAGTSSSGRQGSTGAHASDVLAFEHIPAKYDVLPTKKELVTDRALVDGRGGREMLTSAKPWVVFQQNNMLNNLNLNAGPIGHWSNNVRSWGVKGDDACHPHDSLDYTCELLLKRDFDFTNALGLSTCKRVVGGSHDLVQVAGWMEHATGTHLKTVSKGATSWTHKLGYKPHDIRSRLFDNPHLENLRRAGLTELSCYKWKAPYNEPAHQGFKDAAHNTDVKTVGHKHTKEPIYLVKEVQNDGNGDRLGMKYWLAVKQGTGSSGSWLSAAGGSGTGDDSIWGSLAKTGVKAFGSLVGSAAQGLGHIANYGTHTGVEKAKQAIDESSGKHMHGSGEHGSADRGRDRQQADMRMLSNSRNLKAPTAQVPPGAQQPASTAAAQQPAPAPQTTRPPPPAAPAPRPAPTEERETPPKSGNGKGGKQKKKSKHKKDDDEDEEDDEKLCKGCT